jgi:hypothetical protein
MMNSRAAEISNARAKGGDIYERIEFLLIFKK